MHAFCLATFAAICLNANALASACGGVERSAFLMGTTLRVTACASDRDQATAAIEAAFAETARLEAVLSSWRSDSEIGRLNAAPAHARVGLSNELSSLLAEAGRWVHETDGAFDPALGALIDAWGFRASARIPAAASLVNALENTGWSRAHLDAGTLVRGPAGWWIDTGGFGKGVALRSAAAVLRAHGIDNAVLDFGGQLLVMGGPATVQIAHPLQRNQATLSLQVRDVSVATSSQSERFIEADGARFGHVLDPRTGKPVPAWGSVTVVATDAMAADALSTALFVMGPQAALAWADQHPEIGVLVLEVENGNVRAAWSRGMKKWTMENVHVDQ